MNTKHVGLIFKSAAVAAVVGLVAVGCTPEDATPITEPDTTADSDVGTSARTNFPEEIVIEGDAFHPESITTSDSGTIYASSITTGEIVAVAPDSDTPETFVPAGVNVGTAGILVDEARDVLWACSIDPTFEKPTELRSFDLSNGEQVASYTLPDDGAGKNGVCADIAIADGDVYITDTLVPRIFRLTTPTPSGSADGDLSLWSEDAAFAGEGLLQINGLAFDGNATFYTTNYSTGVLVKVPLNDDGSAGAAEVIDVGENFSNPDGIRMLDQDTLLVAENAGRLNSVNVQTGEKSIVADTLDQPTSVAVDSSPSGPIAWVAEGQVLRLQAGEPANTPFKVRRVDLSK